MTIEAKTILKNKYWIIEDGDTRLGTLSFDNERYIFTNKNEVCVFDDKNALQNKFGGAFSWRENDTVVIEKAESYDVNGFPTGSKPYKCVYDLKKKISLFSKSNKSESLYCAGYFILKFPKGWTKAFCPKLTTIEQYEYKGPFKNILEMKQALSAANKEK